jgi:hypothetical protein
MAGIPVYWAAADTDHSGAPLMRKLILLTASHLAAGFLGVALGIYLLPILIAPESPTATEVQAAMGDIRFTGQFRRGLEDSDALHWGEGSVTIGRDAVTLEGRLAPGPDYRLYLSPEFVETEADFQRLKPSMAQVGTVRTFENFIVPLPASIDPARYSTVVIWCESFSQFITAAEYFPADSLP